MAYNGVSHMFQYDVRDRTIRLNLNGPSAAITSLLADVRLLRPRLAATELSGRAANYAHDWAA